MRTYRTAAKVIRLSRAQSERLLSLAQTQLPDRLRPDLTEEQKAEALRIGRIGDQFKSPGATRKR